MGVPAVVQHICLLVVLCSVPTNGTGHHFRGSKDFASTLQEETHVKVGIDGFTLDGIEEAAKLVDSFPLEEFGWAQLQGRYVGEMTCHAKHEEASPCLCYCLACTTRRSRQYHPRVPMPALSVYRSTRRTQ